MIQITYNEMGDMMFLRAEGHADFAPKGQDIVCAAVSALMQTLAYSLDSGTVTCADDRNLMVVQAKQGTDSLAKFELVTDGLILLADAYPEHVRYINMHADKADAIDLQLFADGGTGANGGRTLSRLVATAPLIGEPRRWVRTGKAMPLSCLPAAGRRAAGTAERGAEAEQPGRGLTSQSRRAPPAPPRGEPLAVRKSLSWTRKRQRTRTKPRARTARRRAKARPRARRSGGKPLVSCCAESMPT